MCFIIISIIININTADKFLFNWEVVVWEVRSRFVFGVGGNIYTCVAIFNLHVGS
jgi:hypothetical protein